MIRKEDCEHSTIWLTSNHIYERRNLSLIKKIGEISSQIYHGTFCNGGNKVILHSINRELIESTGFYNADTQIFLDRYNVVFDDACDYNVIYIYNDIIEKPHQVYFKTFKSIPTFDPNEIEELKKKYCGYIEIKRIFMFLK